MKGIVFLFKIKLNNAARLMSLLLIQLSVLSALLVAEEEKVDNTRYPYKIGEANKTDFHTGGHWFNCGPTGIRAKITKERRTEFEVQYVFSNSPGYKKVFKGDRIIGANGRVWKEKDPMMFGAHKSFGYYGPRLQLGKAIEESEGGKRKGKLTLIILRKGKKINVSIALKPIGKFSPTFPSKCKKTQILIKGASEYLIKQADSKTYKWQGHGHIQFMCLMGLLAQGDTYKDFIKKFINANHSLEGIEDPKLDKWTWVQAMRGIMFAELYLASKDKRLLPTMKYLETWYTKAANPWGAYKHHPYKVEGEGYGPMAYPTALTCTAWALFKRCGLKINEKQYMKSRHLLDYLTKENGSIGYGAGLKDGVTVPKEIKLVKGSARTGKPARLWGATAFTTMVHFLDPCESYSDYYVQRGTEAIGYAKELFPDGHGSAAMHLYAGFMSAALAPAVGRDDIYREVLDYYKYWLNVNRCHDGSFYNTPMRDASTDPFYGTRLNTTGSVLVFLSAPHKNLELYGRDPFLPGIDASKLSGKAKTAYELIKKNAFAKVIDITSKLEKSKKKEEKLIAAALSKYVVDRMNLALQKLKNMEEQHQLKNLVENLIESTALYKGISEFDEKTEDLLKAFNKGYGKSAYSNLMREKYSTAEKTITKLLEGEDMAPRIGGLMQNYLSTMVNSHLDTIKALHEKGDVYLVVEKLKLSDKLCKNVIIYENALELIRKELKDSEVKKLVKLGKSYYKLLNTYTRTKKSNDFKKITAFAEKYGESYYGKAAAAVEEL